MTTGNEVQDRGGHERTQDLGHHVGRQVTSFETPADQQAQPPFRQPLDGIALEAEDGQVTPPMCAVGEEGGNSQPRLRLLLHAPAPVSLDVDGYDDHKRVKATTRAVDLRLAALLLPLPGDIPEPEVRFDQAGNSLRIQVQWPGRRDDITWAYGETPAVVVQ